MFVYDFAHFITKVTAVPVEWIFFRRKTYYEDKTQKSRHYKGGVLYVSNHKSFWDYICYFFVVYLHRLRPVVSDLIYHRNPVLTFFLKMCGAIPVGKSELDLSFIDTCVSLLRQGKKIVIFPEAHFTQGDKILPFAPSFAKIALEADVPIVPLYTNGDYRFSRRTRVAVGRRIYPCDIVDSISAQDVQKLCDYTYKKVDYLRSICTRRSRTGTLSFKHFPMDFGRIVSSIAIWPGFRPRWHASGKYGKPAKLSGPFILACNHRSFVDPVALIVSLPTKRVHILMANVVYGEGKHPIRERLLKDIGTIGIDRESLDIEAINKCCDVLEKGKVLALFPEGHLAKGKELEAIKDGAAMISSRTQTPILPIYLCSSKTLGTKHFFSGDPIFPEGKGMAGIKKQSEQLIEAIRELKRIAIKEGYEHE